LGKLILLLRVKKKASCFAVVAVLRRLASAVLPTSRVANPCLASGDANWTRLVLTNSATEPRSKFQPLTALRFILMGSVEFHL